MSRMPGKQQRCAGESSNNIDALKIYSANGNGFLSKKSALTADLIKNDIDVACFQETKLDSLTTVLQSHVENFHSLRADRTSHGGGVLLLVRAGITYYQLGKITSGGALEAVAAVVLGTGVKKTVVISVYRPPISSKSHAELNQFVNEMSTLLDKVRDAEPTAHLVIAGDLNINSLSAKEVSYLDEVCADYCLTQHIRAATHLTNCIDHLLLSDDLTADTVLGPTLEKKKNILAGHATIVASVRAVGIVARPPQDVRSRRLWHKADWPSIVLSMHSQDLHRVVAEAADVEEAAEKFTMICKNAIEEFVPVKTSRTKRGRQPPWWDRTILPLLRHRDRLYKLMKSNSSSVEHVRNYQNARCRARKAIATAKKQYILGAFAYVTNVADFWKAYTGLFKTPKESVPALLGGNGLITDAAAKATAINMHCATKWPPVPVGTQPKQFDSSVQVPPDRLCSPTWTLEQLLKLNAKKATGADDLPPLFLKMVAEIIYRPLTTIFNMSLTEGRLPTLWRHAIVVPIPKVRNPQSADDFRPLAVTCTVCKLMERHVKTLIEHAAPDAVPPFQYAFEVGVGTTDAMQHVMYGVGKSMDYCKMGNNPKKSKASNVSVVAIDLARAFDSVPHHQVVDTLSDRIGLPDFIIRWIQAFLSGRTQQVRVNNKLSTSIAVTASIIQGSTLGPTLFKYYLAGLRDVELAPTTTLVQFADDVALIAPTQDDAQVELLQRDVDLVVAFFSSVGLKTNAKKSQHLLASVSTLGATAKPLTVDNVPIQQVKTLKYLGFFLDAGLTMKEHVEKVTRRARGMLHQVRGELQRHNCRLAIHRIYCTCIRPIMTYALAIYYPSSPLLQQRLARVDRIAAHTITNNWIRGTGDKLVQQLKWPTLAQLACAERVSQFWQYANGIKRTPGGNHVIAEYRQPEAHSARLRARQEQSTPHHTQYQVVGVSPFISGAKFNTPLATAAHLYNNTAAIVLQGVDTAKRVKAFYVANERGRLLISD